MVPFKVMRHEDVSGVSGTGVVAVGVIFTENSHFVVVTHWLSDIWSTVWPPQPTLQEAINAIEHVHGHDGKTVLSFGECFFNEWGG